MFRTSSRFSALTGRRIPRASPTTSWSASRPPARSATPRGGVLDGIVAFEGSTNWSSAGEGTGISLTAAKQSPGFKAQNNTLAVYVNAYEIAKFAARLDYEHSVAASQPQPNPAAASQPQPEPAAPPTT